MSERIDLTDPKTLLDYSIIQLLVHQYPDITSTHATVFIFAAEGDATLEDAVEASDISEVIWKEAFNDMHELGLVQDTSPWKLTVEGERLLAQARKDVKEFLHRAATS
jgi:hypothetical protein